MPIARRTLSLLLVPLLLLLHAPFSLAQIEGETWTSPTYGFSVSWSGTSWEPDNNATLAAVGPEHLDRLHLIDGISSLYFEGAARYEGDLLSCVGEEANLLAEEAGVTEIKPYRLDDVADLVASGPRSEAAAFMLKLDVGGDAIDLVDYVECRELIPGEAVLVITLVSEPRTFKRELEAAQPVVDTIAFAGEQTLDPLAAYGDLISAATAAPSLAGPLSGEIESGPGVLGVKRAGVDAPDFYARAEFENPTPRQDLWDFGLGFRDSGEDEQFRLIVDSAGTWFFKNALDAVIASGTLVDIDRSQGGSNIVEVVASGDTGYFAFNERLVSELDLSGRPQGGDVYVGAGFFDADATEVAATDYRDFEVWSLAGVSLEEPTSPAIQLDAATFDQVVQATEGTEPLAGPAAGTVQPHIGNAAVHPAGVDVENFVARVAFVNPATDTESPWDVGLAFREQDNGDHYRLTVASDGVWEYKIGVLPALTQGSVSTLNTRPGAVNTIEVVVDGDAAGFAVNGRFVSALDASELRGSSDVWVGAGFHQENVGDDQESSFDGFTVWELNPETSTAWPPSGTPMTEPVQASPTASPARATPTATAMATPVVSRAGPRQQALRLSEQDDSGVDGVAVLSENEDTTTLIITARGTSGGEIVVVHNGTCDSVDESASSMVGEIDDDGKSRAEVERSLPELADGQHAIAILGGDGGKILACGAIPTLR